MGCWCSLLYVFLSFIAFVVFAALRQKYLKAHRPRRDGDGTWQLASALSSDELKKQKPQPVLVGGKPICVVVGGGGFLGQNLVRRLLKEGKFSVRIADLRSPPPTSNIPLVADGAADDTVSARFVQTDLCNLTSVTKALEGAELVFHTATAAPTGANALNDELMYRVNVIGTRNLLVAAHATSVRHVVYTSTASVVFEGSDLKGVDESAPFASVHLDYYNQTKAEAERCVLASQGVGGLNVVALRPSGIFGENDPLLTPTIVANARLNKARFILGSGKNKFDFTYVGNVCQAHVMAADALRQTKTCEKVKGNAYFVTNADPQPFWDFMSRLLEGLNFPASKRPHIKLPLVVMMPLAYVSEAVLLIVSLFKKNVQSDFTTTRICLASAERHISCERAKRDFGYIPETSIDEALRRTIDHFRHLRFDPAKDK